MTNFPEMPASSSVLPPRRVAEAGSSSSAYQQRLQFRVAKLMKITAPRGATQAELAAHELDIRQRIEAYGPRSPREERKIDHLIMLALANEASFELANLERGEPHLHTAHLRNGFTGLALLEKLEGSIGPNCSPGAIIDHKGECSGDVLLEHYVTPDNVIEHSSGAEKGSHQDADANGLVEGWNPCHDEAEDGHHACVLQSDDVALGSQEINASASYTQGQSAEGGAKGDGCDQPENVESELRPRERWHGYTAIDLEGEEVPVEPGYRYVLVTPTGSEREMDIWRGTIEFATHEGYRLERREPDPQAGDAAA